MWTPFAQQSPHTKGSITFPFLPDSININKMLIKSILPATVSINSSFWKSKYSNEKKNACPSPLFMNVWTQKEEGWGDLPWSTTCKERWLETDSTFPVFCGTGPWDEALLKKQYFDSKHFHQYLVDCFLIALGRRKHASARDCRPCCAAWSWFPKRDPFF